MRYSKKVNKLLKEKIENLKKYIISMLEKLKLKLKELTFHKVAIFLLAIAIIWGAIAIFMKFTLFISVDGSVYHTYLDYFKGKSLASWNTIRGFGFPLILFVITELFGDNTKGVLIGFLLFYLGMIFCAFKIIYYLIKDNNLKKRQATYWVLFIVFFLFNPLILSYSHMLLTEAVVPFFYLLGALICLKWSDINFKEFKRKFIVYFIIISILGVFIWQIKQPYAFAYWALIGITAIVNGIWHKSFKIFLQKILVLFSCIIFTGCSVVIWNRVIINSKIDMNSSPEEIEAIEKIQEKNQGQTTRLVSNFLINGIGYHYKSISKKIFCDIDYIENKKMDKKIKERVLNFAKENEEWCNNIKVYDIYDFDNNYVETDVFIQGDNSIKNVIASIKFYLHLLTTHPIFVLDSYYQNYLGILNFKVVNNNTGLPIGMIQPYIRHENVYSIFQNNVLNYWWGDENIKKSVPEDYILTAYEGELLQPTTLSSIMLMLSQFTDATFSFFLYFSMPIFIYGFVMCIKHRQNKSYFMITILSGAAFTGVFFHVFTGAVIDRYAYPVYPLMLLCIIIMFMDKSKKYELIQQRKKENKRKKISEV